jgi:O-methyltransferase
VSSLRGAKHYLPAPLVDAFRRTRLRFRRRYHAHARHEYGDRREFFRKALMALEFNGIAGDYAEFGCCGAMTFCMAYEFLAQRRASAAPVHLWAFDSFQGLPESAVTEDAHPVWTPGSFKMSLEEFHRRCRVHRVPRDAYTVVPGFFEETLGPGASGARPEKIRLAYVDCDMYSSTQTVLRFLEPRLQHGMILAFDDYYCCSASLPSGERLAAAEMFATHPRFRLVPYVQFGWHGMSFLVEQTGPGQPSGNHGTHW